MSRQVFQAFGGGEREVWARAMLQRGYRYPQLQQLLAEDNSPAALVGGAAEKAIRRRLRLSRRLPCGEPLRLDPETAERECWLHFQFETGVHGDRYLRGSGGPREEFPT